MVKKVLIFLGVIFVFSLVFALLNRRSPNIAIIRVRGVILNPLPIEQEIEKSPERSQYKSPRAKSR